MACFVPDTNVFLQCRPLAEVEWHQVTSDEAVELVVVAQVYRELDRLKHGASARRVRRARRWLELLRPVALDECDEVVLRESRPRVVLRLAPRLRPGALDGSVLDLDIADERIVAEALAFAQGGDVDVGVLSDDGMALRAAREVGLGDVPVPSSWLAEPEPDEGQRRVAELERQVAGLLRQVPVIDVRAVIDGDPVTRIEATYLLWPELTPDFIAHAMARVRAAHPGPRTAGSARIAIVGDAVDYGRANYDVWLANVEKQLAASARLALGFTDPFSVHLVLENSGGASADGLVVDVQARGAVRLSDPEALDEIREKLSESFPTPPKPRSMFALADVRESMLPPIPRFPISPAFVPRGVSEFAWSFDPPEALSGSARGECDEFRHGLQPERFAFGLRPPLDATGDCEGALVVRVSARNLGAPQQTVIPVVLRPRLGDTEARVARQLERDLGVRL